MGLSDDNAPSGVALVVGGNPEHFSASVCFYAAELDPADLSAALGVEPTRSFRAGYRAGPRSPPAARGLWMLEATATESPTQCVEGLFQRLPSDPTQWQALGQRYEVQIRITLAFGGWNRGLVLSSSAIQKIANTGAAVQVDLYSDDRWEEA
jgi:hypothetical protein